MKIAGIIAEYNPFHNGHKLQLDTLKAQGCDAVIVAMSGMFTQRGTPALLDKWTRAEAALRCGADLVFELPCLFALREAQGFARGGVRLLSGTGVVDALAFGCEPEAIKYITPVATLLREEPEDYRALLKQRLADGMSYPRARAEAAAELLGFDKLPDGPNFALSLEYAQANMELYNPLELLPLERLGSHNDAALPVDADAEAPQTRCASSSAIRAALTRGDNEAALSEMPPESAALLASALNPAARSLRALAWDDRLDDMALAALRQASPEALRNMSGVAEGLENLLIKAARESATLEEALMRCKSRRYTYARLRRIPMQLLLGITRKMQLDHPYPRYARLLGARREALPLLREIERRGALPLITDVTRLPHEDAVWRLETRATDLWGLCSDSDTARRAGWDYRHKFLIV